MVAAQSNAGTVGLEGAAVVDRTVPSAAEPASQAGVARAGKARPSLRPWYRGHASTPVGDRPAAAHRHRERSSSMCIFGCLGLFAPRVVTIFLWIFTDLVNRAFSSFIWPLLGIVFLPFTTMFYVLVYSVANKGPTGLGWALVVFGLLLDLGSYSSSYRERRRVPGFRG
jgi:hypothetical protein